MPQYDYLCTNNKCGAEIEDQASMTGYKEHHPPCPKCGSLCNYLWKPYVPHTILRDGPSGSWPSKGERVKKYRQKSSEAAGRREKDRYGHLKRDAVPNFQGKETGTWAEAQFQALKEKGTDSAATYNPKVAEERKKKIS